MKDGRTFVYELEATNKIYQIHIHLEEPEFNSLVINQIWNIAAIRIEPL